jgi:hypothetical protein
MAVTRAAHTKNAPVDEAIPADFAGLAELLLASMRVEQAARLGRSFALAAE